MGRYSGTESSPMKIMLTHRYFWPDTPPYAAILRSIGNGLADAGHDVSVFASVPSYRGKIKSPRREKLGKLNIFRCRVFSENKANPPVRILNVLLYCTALFFAVLRQRPDIVTASTFPPVLAPWVASLAARIVGAKFIYHIMDIHPEVSRYSSGRMGKGFLAGLMTWLDNKTLRRSSAIVVLSEDMADTLGKRGIGNLPIHIINNFLLEDFGSGTPPDLSPREKGQRTQIIFAGNFGRFQDLPLLTDGIARCLEKHADLELLLLGNGADEARLKAKWGDHPQIRFLPFTPFAKARKTIAAADIGLVSLAPNIYRVSYPSKMLTYLGLGLPVLALVEPESHLAKAIVSGNLGAVPSERTAEGVAEALENLLENLDMNGKRQRYIRDWVRENSSRETAVVKWQRIIEEVSGN